MSGPQAPLAGMPGLKLIREGDGAWPDLLGRVGTDQVIQLQHMQVASLAGGMQSGKASVMIRLDLPDGRVVLAETSLELFTNAARVMQAWHEMKQVE